MLSSVNLPQLSVIYVKTSFLEPSRNPGVITDVTFSIQMITGHPLIILIQMNHILEAHHLFGNVFCLFVCVKDQSTNKGLKLFFFYKMW